MKRFLFFTLLLCLSGVILSAQNNSKQAESLVDKFLLMLKNNAVEADFQLTISEKASGQQESMRGKFSLKADKFRMETEDFVVCFNGKTQWLYMIDNAEITITEPNESEQADINPMAILDSFRKESKIRFAPNPPADGNYHIELIPRDTRSEIARIQLLLNKTTENLVYINQVNKKGGSMKLQLKNFRKNRNLADRYFDFDSKQYPEAQINDLR